MTFRITSIRIAVGFALCCALAALAVVLASAATAHQGANTRVLAGPVPCCHE